MRTLLTLLRVIGVFALVAALVVAGSTAVQETRSHARAIEGAQVSRHDAARRAHAAPGVVIGQEEAVPGGGVSLDVAPRCDPTSVRPGVSDLQAGMARFAAPGWATADGGVSAPLGDGRVVWLFGDTRRDVATGGGGMVSNSMILSSGACFSQVTAGRGAIIPDPGAAADRKAAWPTAVTTVDHGTWSEVLVFTGTVQRRGGFWGFTLLGTSLTRFVVPDGGAPRRMETTPLTADDDDPRAVTWGTAAAAQGEWLYIYGTRVTGASLGREVYVARTRLANVANVRGWQFRGRAGWGASTQMTPVVDAAPGTSHIISVFERDGEWYLVSKAGGDLGDDVGVWRAASPAAAFSLVARTPRSYSLGGARVRYMPLAHPEFGGGHDVVVTMSRNVTTGPDVARDHSLGRPEFFTLSLPDR